MRIMMLAAGLATGYLLGAREGRDRYDQITATARKLSARSHAVQAGPEATDSQPHPAAADGGTRPARNRRAKAAPIVTTPSAPDQAPAMSTANRGLDGGPLAESAEADVVEQNTPVVDNGQESAVAPTPLESEAADVHEQRQRL